MYVILFADRELRGVVDAVEGLVSLKANILGPVCAASARLPVLRSSLRELEYRIELDGEGPAAGHSNTLEKLRSSVP